MEEKKNMEEEKTSQKALNFIVPIPGASEKHEEKEKTIKTYLENDDLFTREHGDPIMIIITGKEWREVAWGEKGRDRRHLLECCAIGFNYHPIPFDNTRSTTHNTCSLVCFNIRSLNPRFPFEHCEDYTYIGAIDTRQLPPNLYEYCIKQYGKELVEKCHLKSSELTQLDLELKAAAAELEKDASKGGSRCKIIVNNIKKLIESGANINCEELDERHLTILHYTHLLATRDNIDLMTEFITYLLDHGADILLGPLEWEVSRERINGEWINLKTFYYLTPYNYFKQNHVIDPKGENAKKYPILKRLGPTDNKRPPPPPIDTRTGKVVNTSACCIIL